MTYLKLFIFGITLFAGSIGVGLKAEARDGNSDRAEVHNLATVLLTEKNPAVLQMKVFALPDDLGELLRVTCDVGSPASKSLDCFKIGLKYIKDNPPPFEDSDALARYKIKELLSLCDPTTWGFQYELPVVDPPGCMAVKKLGHEELTNEGRFHLGFVELKKQLTSWSGEQDISFISDVCEAVFQNEWEQKNYIVRDTIYTDTFRCYNATLGALLNRKGNITRVGIHNLSSFCAMDDNCLRQSLNLFELPEVQKHIILGFYKFQYKRQYFSMAAFEWLDKFYQVPPTLNGLSNYVTGAAEGICSSVDEGAYDRITLGKGYYRGRCVKSILSSVLYSETTSGVTVNEAMIDPIFRPLIEINDMDDFSAETALHAVYEGPK